MNNNLIKVPVSYVHLEDLSILDIFRQDARRHIDIVVECIDSMIAKRNIRGLLDEYSNLRQLKDNLQEWDRRLNRTADDSKQSWLYNQMLNESIDMIVDYFNQSCNDNGNGNGNNIDGHHNHSKISIRTKSSPPPSSTPPSVNNIILSPEPRVESIQKPKAIIMNDKSSLNNSSNHIVNIDDDDDKMIKLLPKPSIQSPPPPPSSSSSSSANNDNAKRKYREKPEIPKDMDWTKPPPPLNSKETATTAATDDSINSSEKCLDVLRNAYNEFRKQTGQPQQPKQQDDNNLADKKLEQLSLNDGQQSNQSSSSSSSSIKKQNPMMNNDESMINNLKNHQCLFCERFGHQDHLCNQYNSIALRQKRAIELNRCYNCFSYDHCELSPTGLCRPQVKCLNPDCQNKKHHTNLCFNYLKQSTKQYQNQNQNQQRNRGKKH